MKSLDELLETATDSYAFSNHTEGSAWQHKHCDNCIHDKEFREHESNGCPLLHVALLGKTPAEWIDTWDGESPFPLGDNYRCTEFVKDD